MPDVALLTFLLGIFIHVSGVYTGWLNKSDNAAFVTPKPCLDWKELTVAQSEAEETSVGQNRDQPDMASSGKFSNMCMIHM